MATEPSPPAGGSGDGVVIRKVRRGSRFKARRRAVEMLFESELRDRDPVELCEEREELSSLATPLVPPVRPYTHTLVEGVAYELDRIDRTIVGRLHESWLLGRLPAVDRAILRVSTWELLFNPDVPAATAVDEGVGLASEYSPPRSTPYINAVLDAIAHDVDELRRQFAAEDAERKAAHAATRAADSDADDARLVAEAGDSCLPGDGDAPPAGGRECEPPAPPGEAAADCAGTAPRVSPGSPAAPPAPDAGPLRAGADADVPADRCPEAPSGQRKKPTVSGGGSVCDAPATDEAPAAPPALRDAAAAPSVDDAPAAGGRP